MVFSSYNSTSYLPLDSDQSVTFYKNENSLFPPLPPSSSSTAVACRPAMLTSTGNGSFCDQEPQNINGNVVSNDFQPVVHLSSNGYYGYIPVNSMPKMMSTGMATVNGTVHATTAASDSASIGVQLDCHPPPAAAAVDDTMMMDSIGMENYCRQPQQQYLRKRKEHCEETDTGCKRRKTWLEQHQQAGFNPNSPWNQPPVIEMECHDQPMDESSSECGIETPVMMNGTPIGFNHQQPIQMAFPQTQSPVAVQPKSKYPETSRCMMSHMI